MIQTLCNLGYKDTANILQSKNYYVIKIIYYIDESGVNIEP